jgi:hypothetical protein
MGPLADHGVGHQQRQKQKLQRRPGPRQSAQGHHGRRRGSQEVENEGAAKGLAEPRPDGIGPVQRLLHQRAPQIGLKGGEHVTAADAANPEQRHQQCKLDAPVYGRRVFPEIAARVGKLARVRRRPDHAIKNGRELALRAGIKADALALLYALPGKLWRSRIPWRQHDQRHAPPFRVAQNFNSPAQPLRRLAVPHRDQKIAVVEQRASHRLVSGRTLVARARQGMPVTGLCRQGVQCLAARSAEILFVFFQRKWQGGVQRQSLFQRNLRRQGVGTFGEGRDDGYARAAIKQIVTPAGSIHGLAYLRKQRFELWPQDGLPTRGKAVRTMPCYSNIEGARRFGRALHGPE